MAKSDQASRYLKQKDRTERLKLLSTNNVDLSLDLAEDLLMLDLSIHEKQAILFNTKNTDNLAYENLLTQNLLAWDQNLAATAINIWQANSNHTLWFRLLLLNRAPMVPQRVRYTIMLNAFNIGGKLLMEEIHKTNGFDELSDAFYGMWLHRLLQWNIEFGEAKEMALTLVNKSNYDGHPDNKAVVSAIQYLARFAPNELIKAKTHPGSAWNQLANGVFQFTNIFDAKSTESKILAHKGSFNSLLNEVMPPVWLRHKISSKSITAILAFGLKSNYSFNWNDFSGFKDTELSKALANFNDEKLSTLLKATHGFLSEKQFATVSKNIRSIDALHRSSFGIPKASPFHKSLEAERLHAISGEVQVPLAQIEIADKEITDNDRREFFNIAYRKTSKKFSGKESFWKDLAKSFLSPNKNDLASLAENARKIEGIYKISYINTLGQFYGQDDAVLKLLDFIRSEEEDELRAVVKALSTVNTPRADQELIATLTRPNISHSLRLSICGELAKHDLVNLQKELRSAFSDIQNNGFDTEVNQELLDAVGSLLITDISPSMTKNNPSVRILEAPAASSDSHLDQLLTEKIQSYKLLSSEVKRALRTAQFFHLQVTADNAPESIDLSPVIDMQYKALELLFRETFENACTQLIHNGVLQRKLDVIGYARPIVRQMDEFENYIANLEIIRKIPFFSKFKMRKMLRAICQFRPGRRFTLDGLKAFAIFFICFGREECRYSLDGIMKLDIGGDKQLFEFCSKLHTLQDARNRAAHEGFHPDASNDINGVWTSTSEIIATSFVLKTKLQNRAEEEFAPKNHSNPVITRKVS